jgi:phosphate acetyltransferase
LLNFAEIKETDNISGSIFMNIMDRITETARKNLQRVVFPESTEERIIKAARKLVDEKIAVPYLIGDADQIKSRAKEINVSTEGFNLVSQSNEAENQRLIRDYLVVNSEYSEKSLTRKIVNPLSYAAMMVKAGHADCLAAGVTYSTGDVILAAMQMIGMEEGNATPSSVGIFGIPGFKGSEGEFLAWSDCAVCTAPDPSQLADIAITSACTVADLLGWEPRVAMLSFSTKGSAEHDKVDQVRKAIEIVKEKKPGLKIDGEFQMDSALLPEIAARKVGQNSEVAGKANILIFPDLSAGNIAVKTLQIFKGCKSYGPILQGFSRPVTDFSRGASVDDVAGNVAIACVRAQKFGIK